MAEKEEERLPEDHARQHGRFDEVVRLGLLSSPYLTAIVARLGLSSTEIVEMVLSKRAAEPAWPLPLMPWERDRQAAAQGRRVIAVLGTGGTMASTTVPGDDTVFEPGYIAIADLVDEVRPGLPDDMEVISEQVLNGLTHPNDWQRLVTAIADYLAMPHVAGIVITSGTDVLEETAYLLFRLFSSVRLMKPIVLAAAMRPHSARSPDGPRNLRDAILVAATPGAHGVCVVMNSVVLSADGLRKIDTETLDAFWSPGDPIASITEQEGPRVEVHGRWPTCEVIFPYMMLDIPTEKWPRVEIAKDHVGADGRLIELAWRAGLLDGLVVETSGAGTMRSELEEVVRRMIQAWIPVVITSRTAYGVARARRPLDMLGGKLSAVQARLAVMLELLYVYWLLNSGVLINIEAHG